MACQSLSADPGFALHSSLLTVFDRFHGGGRKEERFNECVIREQDTKSKLSFPAIHSTRASNYLLCEQQLVSLQRERSSLFCPWTHSWVIKRI